MQILGWLWDTLREAAILLAAVGLAKWSWDQHTGAIERRDIEARRIIEEGRARAELKSYQESRLEQSRVRTERDRIKIAIHRLLHASTEPFLTFAEVRAGLAWGDRKPPEDDELRHCLMELVAERCVAQMEQDRYFVAGEFEADDAVEDKS